MVAEYLREQIKNLPINPGVYLFKDAGGGIIYIGKASRLRHRVRSYFSSQQKLTPKTQRMVALIRDIEFFITGSEQEALILELNLVRRHRPHYNVRLKDDKSFPYIKINVAEKWPRIHATRQLIEDGGRYFGPFANARSVKQTLKVIKKIFPLRTCAKNLEKPLPRPCLEYDIGQCNAPCTNSVSSSEYADVVRQTILFLEGKQEKVIKELEAQMHQCSENEHFEQAAALRDQIMAVKGIIEGQQIATRVKGEQDAIAFVQEGDVALVQVFYIRGGKLIGRDSFTLQGTRYETPQQIMTSFVEQFYSSATSIPPLILLQHPIDRLEIVEDWLVSRRCARVQIQSPQRGGKKELVDIVAQNARQALAQAKIRHISSPETLEEAMEELQQKLNLPSLPKRIEGYDISNISGTSATGSMVVFEKGKPAPARYRRFRIKTVAGADDYAMMEEVIRRRFGHAAKDENQKETGWASMPNLILIDGGKGQLGSALEAMREASVTGMPIIGLAKEREEIFLPHRSQPLVLPATSVALKLLQRVRDEAHRFALGYHHNIRNRRAFASALDDISGIGPRRKRNLIRRFGSVEGIRRASLEELSAAKGISPTLARKIKEHL